MSNTSTSGAILQSPARDAYGREVRSLRLSVTQRCDLACSHCHREGQAPSSIEMRPDEIERIVRIANTIGVRSVKLTGGEPLIRDDIVDVVKRTSGIVREVSLTTNGSRLWSLAPDLKRAGLKRVNVSLHSLNPDIYSSLCGVDLSTKVMRGVGVAVEAGLSPVKVNMVVLKGQNENEIEDMMEFCGKVGAVLQLIEYASDRKGSDSQPFRDRFYPLRGVEEWLARTATETSTNELHRRRRYTVKANGGAVTVEVVRPMHNTEFCANCTRIRVSSDGLLKPCLLDPSGAVDILGPLRAGASDDKLRTLLLKAIENRRPYWS